jgi:hypothetical protein
MTPLAHPIDLDRICKRQTARFLDHLRDTGQHTEQLERDFLRMMRFTFDDVKKSVREFSTENSDEPRKK